jgi:hypothetical protein
MNNPEFDRFLASIHTAENNALIIFAAVCLLLITYLSINWYPVTWQSAARTAAQAFALVLLGAMVYLSL